MEINSNTPSTAPALTVSLTAKSNNTQSNWKPGQELLVRVLSSSTGTPRNSATIDVGGKIFQAQTNTTLQVGQQFRAIASLNNKTAATSETLTLTIINNNTKTETINRALRSAMPQQAPLAQVFNNLSQLLQSVTTGTATVNIIPTAVLTLIRELLNKLPSLSNIETASSLKNVLLHSGLFLESALAMRSEQVNDDLKATLLKLIAQIQISLNAAENNKQLREILRQLQRQSESALARIQLNQLQSLKQEGSPQPLLAELPVWEKDRLENIRLLITRDNSRQQSNGNPCPLWQVRLQITRPELGSIEATIAIKNEQTDISFVAQETHTADLFKTKLAELRQDLISHGQTIAHLSCHSGRIEKLDSRPDTSLFEAKA